MAPSRYYGTLFCADTDEVIRSANRAEMFQSLRSDLAGDQGVFRSHVLGRDVYVYGESDAVRDAALFDIQHGEALAAGDENGGES